MTLTKVGIIICGHGSSYDEDIVQFAKLHEKLIDYIPNYPISYGFLELNRPDLCEGFDKLCDQGVNHILALPCMLFADDSVNNNIMRAFNHYAAERVDRGLTIEIAGPLDIGSKILYAAQGCITDAEAIASSEFSREDTLLLVVGRGSSNPDSNSNISKVCRMLWEGMGYGWGQTCYIESTFPGVAAGLEHAAMLEYKRIIVLPYLLFTGVCVEKIYTVVDKISLKFPNIEFIKVSHLNNHRGVLDALIGNVDSILAGDKNMNCMLCKYREQVIGLGEDHSHPHGEDEVEDSVQEKLAHSHTRGKTGKAARSDPGHLEQKLSDAE
jgi:sirohydrochlorin cobaltochelatase